MWVCLCRGVSSGTIAEVVEGGARTVREVSQACGAATDCTKCTRTVRTLIARHTPGTDQEDEPE
jgi:bacterioferritin-associated ferredoxin